MDFFIKELATLDTPEWRADVVKEYLRRGYIKSTSARPGVKAKMSKTEAVEDVVNALYIAERKIQAMMQDGQRGNLSSVKKDIDYLRGVSAAIKQRIEKFESTGFSRSGVKAKMAASDIIVKKDAQYIYYYPEDDDRATFPDDNGKGAYTVKSNRTGKPVSAKTYRSLQEAVSASNAMNEKLPPLKKAKASRPGVKAKMGSSQVNDAATTADLIREAQRLRDVIKTSNREFDKTHLRQIKQELDKRGVLMPYGASEVLASRPGAKAKA
jgi:hypothetical protein